MSDHPNGIVEWAAPPATDTTETVLTATVAVAGTVEKLAEGVDALNAGGAPDSEFHHFRDWIHNRVAACEAAIGTIEPAINEIAPLVSLIIPAAAPILNRLPEIESFLAALVGALQGHFGGKLALPTPPAISLPADHV